MKMDLNTTQTSTALLCNVNGVDAQETKSLCCAAAGIIDPISATAEALIPHEKLREAATPDATLIAQNRPPAQLVAGYSGSRNDQKNPEQIATKADRIDERAEFEKEFPIPEGLQYCRKRVTYIRTPGASTSDTFAREHYAYKAGFAAWMRRAWKIAALEWPQARGEQQKQSAVQEGV
jgi:hypothetical protein